MKKALAAVLASGLALSLSISSFAAVSGGAQSDVLNGSIVTKNDVKNPIYNYAVPVANTFAIDAFQKFAQSGQIYSGNFSIINKSDVPLRVAMTPTLAFKTGVTGTVAASPAEIPNSATDVSKAAYIEMVPATTATINTTDGAIVSDTLNRPVFGSSKDKADSGDIAVPKAQVTEGLAAGKFKLAPTAKVANEAHAVVGSTLDLVVSYTADSTASTPVYTEIGRVTSDALTAALAGVADKTAAVFAGKTIELLSDPSNASSEKVSCAVTESGGALTITAAADGITDYITTNTNGAFKLKIMATPGVEATAELSTEDGAATYAEYSDATGTSSTGKVVAVLSSGTPESLTFAVDRATYSKAYANDAEPTLCTTIAADTCGAVYTIRGAVNPNAAWEKDDMELTVKYEVNGISTSAYTNRRTATSGEANLINNSKEPTLATTGGTPTASLNLSTASTKVEFKFANGTKDSLIVAGDAPTAYTVSIQDVTLKTDPVDITATAALTIASGNAPTLTFDKQAMIDSGAIVSGNKYKFIFTFTGTDNYVTTIAPSNEFTLTYTA